MSQQPSAQEQLDLLEFKKKRAEIQDNAFNAINDILRCNEEQLKHRGYKEHGQAVIGTFKYYEQQIQTLLKAFLKKYPD